MELCHGKPAVAPADGTREKLGLEAFVPAAEAEGHGHAGGSQFVGMFAMDQRTGNDHSADA